MAIGYYDHPVMLGVPGEDLPHVHHYYGEPHPHYRQRVVDRRRRQLRRRVGARDVSRRRARHDRPPRADAEVDDQILGAARHREPDQGRLDRRAVQRVRPRNPAGVGRDCAVACDGAAVVAPPRASLFPARRFGGLSTRRRARRPSGEDGDSGRRGLPADRLPRRRGSAAPRRRRRSTSATRRSTIRRHFETNVPGLFVAGGAIAGVDTGTIFIENGRFHGERSSK